MAETTFDPDRHLDAVLPTLGLALPAEWRPAVVAHLVAIQKAAESVLSVKLGDDVEPAPVFEP